ncbi:DUF2220 domain-containing protein [Paenibacillus sp. MBLB2552]|uniref:DUF2220 domain-containing protein n=1 Tax=Paenibacillus mellifer TaxID=2937794 RepID=A0A9X1XYV9_9BACL|nr:Wadjet anti-phage system protein JetD domain-containing protein [Paenibacillus mellifer]MCK8488265.1 DUF2220 domain-containing protein [Paenibacillus mellifer]
MNKEWLLNYLNTQKNRTFDIHRLEKAFMSAVGIDAFSYKKFASFVRDLEYDGEIVPVKNKQNIHNGKDPHLPVEWRLIKKQIESRWNIGQFMTLASLIDLSFYQSHPGEQTEEAWSRILAVAAFLESHGPKIWVSREERSYQLFHDEKWMDTSEGKEFLRRIKKTLPDLYARVYGEPFVYWLQPRMLTEDVRRILIVENRSLFHSCRRVLEESGNIYGLSPELLIFGRGKHIVSSLSYLEDLRVPVPLTTIWYAGDYDPSGFAIYDSLKRSSPDYPIQLAITLYEEMAQQAKSPVPVKPGQVQNREQVALFFEEVKPYPLILDKAEQSWSNRVRFPQEAISYENMQKGGLT